MNNNLLGNLECKTSFVKIGNSYKKQSRGVLGFFLVVFFAVFVSGMVWSQTPVNIYNTTASGRSLTWTTESTNPCRLYVTNDNDEAQQWIMENAGNGAFYLKCKGAVTAGVNPYLSLVTNNSYHMTFISETDIATANYYFRAMFTLIDLGNGTWAIKTMSNRNDNVDYYYTYLGADNRTVYEVKGDKSATSSAYGIWTIAGLSTISISKSGGQITITTTGTDATTTTYYTTDGTDPATSDTREIYSGPFADDNYALVKAIVMKDGRPNSEIVSLFNYDKKFVLQNQANDGFYMLPGVANGDDFEVNTYSLIRPSVEWRITDAGNGDYYLQNDSLGYYLYCNSGGTVRLKSTNDNSNDFKFRLRLANDGSYRLEPKTKDYYFINKADNNNTNSLVTNNSKLSLNLYWNIIPADHIPAPMLTIDLSDDDCAHYYRIKNANNTSYYIIPPTGSNAYANTSNAGNSNDRWFIRQVASDEWLNYYAIINAETGQCLQYNGAAIGTGPAFGTILLAEGEMATTDNVQFAIANTSTTSTDGKCYIIPKPIRYNNRVNYCLIWRDGNTLKTSLQRADNNRKWIFESSSFTCEPPIISYDALQGTVTMTSPNNAPIYYVSWNDGESEPTLATPADGSLYIGPFDVHHTHYKAIVGRCTDGSDKSSITIYDLTEPFRCATPVITYNTSTQLVTITCVTNNATIYYTIDSEMPSNPITGGTTLYNGSFTMTEAHIIRAVAIRGTELSTISEVAMYNDIPIYVSFSSQIGMSGNYAANSDFTVDTEDPIGTETNPFQGKFDGAYVSFSLSHPLFGYVNGATIKNVVVDIANVSESGNVGAIVNMAKGATKIYNCGVLDGSVSGDINTGGLVGLIESGSSVRVVNCYNYADVSGGDYAAGIVGKNEGTVSQDGTVGNVRIALCMMYGSVSGATNISPVYGGNHVGNVQNYTEYNFYLYSNERDDDGNKIEKIPYTVYNDQQAITEEEYLTRFPFHRHILNTHRELGAFFLFGASTSSDVNSITSDEISEIGHWVVKKDIAPYPIVEPWGTNTKKVLNAPTPSNILTEMGTNGYLSVTVNISADGMASGSSAIQTTITLPITDMDEANYDYTWGKVVLPFANEFRTSSNEVWTPDYSKICTGWKITSVTKEGTNYNTYSATNYNFADRDNPQKDIYEGDNLFIFAQGGNYIVPYGVTAITIEANFANAIYLSDATYDVGYTTSYKEPTGLGGNVLNGGNFHGKTVHHNITAALGAASATNTPHTQAIVLVGNYHFPSTDNPNNDYLDSYKTKAFTLMSIDADNNQEPDYAFYSKSWLNRPKVPPMRIDFVALVPLGMAAHVKDSKYYPGLPIWNTRGWFEMTETSLCWANQFELGSSQFNLDATDGKKYNRLIINSGYFVQMVRASKTNSSSGSNGSCQKLVYSQIGGNTYIKEYYPGSHSATPKTTTLVPVNVTGGEIEQCFMTGYGYNETGGVGNYGTVVGDNIYFWCAGGKIGKFLGAYMENPVPVTPGGKVNMTAKIDHALITEFYGGGTSPEAPITGKIDVTIKNSRVDRYCGGPEFGDMTPGETVTTRADKTTFGYFYGAGFGGTGITYYTYEDLTMNINTPSNTVTTTNYPDYFFARHYSPGASDHGRLKVKNGGIGTCYKFEYIVNTSVLDRLVARFYVGFAKFDLATTGNVTNTLTDCTILHDFYGAGCQGKVAGTVTSTLTNCTVNGNAYGAGYKATANDVKVYPTTDPKNPPYALSKYTMATGIFSEFHIPEPEIFQWEEGTAGTSSGQILYTDKPMSTLGDVTGDITLTLEGHTVVNNNVFGGGNESKSLNNATVTIKGTSQVDGNVFGGGNKAIVNQNTTVKLQGNAHVLQNVYGGGNEGPVGGNSKVIIED